MGPDGIFESEFLQAAGEAAEGSYITFGGVPPDQLTGAGADFIKAYNAKYPDQAPEAYTAYGYEAAKVALAAIERASARNPKDNAELRKFVLEETFKTKDYAGILGTWSFNAEGDTSLTDMSGQIVTGGAFVFSEVIK
jgi:branched-chain amino acid transport system substrate-binding protein